MASDETVSQKPRGKAIVPGITTCCNPPAPHAAIHSKFHVEIDADCVHSGDYLTCPNHPEKVLFVFGTGWWTAHGGSFEKNPVIQVYCHLCREEIKIDAWSYRG